MIDWDFLFYFVFFVIYLNIEYNIIFVNYVNKLLGKVVGYDFILFYLCYLIYVFGILIVSVLLYLI